MTERCTICGVTGALPLTHSVTIAGVRTSYHASCVAELARQGRDLTLGVVREALEQKAPEAFKQMQSVWQKARRVAEVLKEK